MRPGGLVLLPAALLLSVASTGCGSGAGGGVGAGGAGSAGGVGSAGAAAGCADIYVSPALLGEPDAWYEAGNRLRGGAWPTEEGMVVAWEAHENVGGDPNDPDYHPWLVLSTFDRHDGRLLDQQLLDDALPPYLVIPGGYYAAGGGPAGSYAVLAAWCHTVSGECHEIFITGRLGSPVLHTGEFAYPYPNVEFIGWDGEAFTFDGTAGYDPLGGHELYTARVSATGELLLPFTKYGRIDNVGSYVDGLQVSTVSETGTTYVFSAIGTAPLLAGHLRDGSPLPGTEGGPIALEAVGMPTTNPGAGRMSANAEGAWLMWGQYHAVLDFQALAQHLEVTGKPDWPAIELRVPGEELRGVPQVVFSSVLARAGGGATFVLYKGDEEAGATAYLREYDGSQLGEPVLVWDGRGDTRSSSSRSDPRDIMMIEDLDGTAWLSWEEHFDNYIKPTRRLMRLAPGCVYPSLWRKVQQGWVPP